MAEESAGITAVPELENRILVWSLSDTVAHTLESCDWYSADSFWLLHLSVAQFIQNQLDNFYADFSDWFNLAEFPDIGEQLVPSEVTVLAEGEVLQDEGLMASGEQPNQPEPAE